MHAGRRRQCLLSPALCCCAWGAVRPPRRCAAIGYEAEVTTVLGVMGDGAPHHGRRGPCRAAAVREHRQQLGGRRPVGQLVPCAGRCVRLPEPPDTRTVPECATIGPGEAVPGGGDAVANVDHLRLVADSGATARRPHRAPRAAAQRGRQQALPPAARVHAPDTGGGPWRSGL
eukprot:gene12059-biopygen12457